MNRPEAASTQRPIERLVPPKRKSEEDPTKTRERLISFFTHGKIGAALRSIGFFIALDTTSGCIARQQFESTIPQQPFVEVPNNLEAATRSGITIRQNPEPLEQSTRPVDLPTSREQPVSLPQILYIREEVGYQRATFEALLQEGFPHVLVRSANVRSISFVSHSILPDSNYGITDEESAHATRAPGAEPSDIVITPDAFHCEQVPDLSETTLLILILAHEFAHAGDGLDNADSTPRERQELQTELSEIVSSDEWRVRFPYVESIHNAADGRRQLELRIGEYFAEAIAYALQTSVEEHETWQERFQQRLQLQFSATPAQAERTARLIMRYFARYAPNYDQRHGYQVRLRYARQLTEERRSTHSERIERDRERLAHRYYEHRFARFEGVLQTIHDTELRQDLHSIFGNQHNWPLLIQTPQQERVYPPESSAEEREALDEGSVLLTTLLYEVEYLHSGFANEMEGYRLHKYTQTFARQFNAAMMACSPAEQDRVRTSLQQEMGRRINISALVQDL